MPVPLLKCIHCGVGWAVHAIILEFVDGTRKGLCLANSGRRLPLNDDYKIKNRINVTEEVDYGDYIIQISGQHTINHAYFCHSITFTMHSGKNISFASTHTPWSSRSFHTDIPKMMMVVNVDSIFREITISVVQNSLCMPLSSPDNAKFLPRVLKRSLMKYILLLNLVHSGMRMVYCWEILSYLNGYDILPDTSTNTSKMIKKWRNSISHIFKKLNKKRIL